MSKRLQVLLDEGDFREIRKLARGRKMTVAEWVRQALDAARRRQPAAGPGRKSEIIEAATAHQFPTADIDQMLSEIEGGYLGGGTR